MYGYSGVSEQERKQGWFINAKGAKVYFDVSKQPVLPLRDGENQYDVLSLGSGGFGLNTVPLVTIRENGQAVCYRLPVEYAAWVRDCVALAYSGMNFFPGKVVFTVKDGKYFADIL